MAESTYMTALMHSATNSDSSSYTKLIDIIDYPAPEPAPQGVDVTTLSDSMFKEIPGVYEATPLDFHCHYSPENYEALKTLENTHRSQLFALWLGGRVRGGRFEPTGISGKFPFKAYLTVSIDGEDVNTARTMTIRLFKNTAVTVKNAIVATLDRTTATAADSPEITVSLTYNPEPSGTIYSVYTWQKRSVNGTTWSTCGETYTGYNTRTITAKTNDGGKVYRCKIDVDGVAGYVDEVYSDECTLT